MSWYQNLESRLHFGEKAIDLTVEKFELYLTGEIVLGSGSDDCPLCMAVSDDCARCDLTIKCEDENSLYCTLYDLSHKGEVEELKSYVKDVVLPYLRGLKEKLDEKI